MRYACVLSIGLVGALIAFPEPDMKIFWGDLNVHTAGNHTTASSYAKIIGSYEADQLAAYAHARGEARLDFCAVTNFYPDLGGLQPAVPRPGPAPWEITRRAAEAANAPGRFVTFQGYEWFGADGDHTVLFHDDQPAVYPRTHLSLMMDELRGKRALLVAHPVSLPTRWTLFDPALTRLVEISAAAKNSEDVMAGPALERGYPIGFVGNGETRESRPGQGSLTAVYAPELSREWVWDALARGRCYATSGERIVLDVRVDGHAMGERFEADSAPSIEVRVSGTRPLEKVEILRNGGVIHTAGSPDTKLEMSYRDAGLLQSLRPENSYYVRVTQRRGPVERKVSQGMEDKWYYTGGDWAWSSPVQLVPSRALVLQWARIHGLSGDAAETAAAMLRALVETQALSRPDPHSDLLHQNFAPFRFADPMPAETALARAEGDAVRYSGEFFNCAEQTPYWLPEWLEAQPPGRAAALESRVLLRAVPVDRFLSDKRVSNLPSGLAPLLAHCRAASLLAEADRAYFLSYLWYAALRAGLADPGTEDVEWARCVDRSGMWAERMADAIARLEPLLSNCRTRPLEWTRLAELDLGPRKRLLDVARQVLARLRERGVAAGLPALWWDAGAAENGGLRRVRQEPRDRATFDLDGGYLASAQPRGSRDFELLRSAAARYGIALQEAQAKRSGEVYVRVTYLDRGRGVLSLSVPGMHGSAGIPGPALVGSGSWRTWVWHLEECSFFPSPATVPAITIRSGGPLSLRRVVVYAPAATAEASGRRIQAFKVSERAGGRLDITVELRRAADIEVSVFDSAGRLVSPIAARQLPAGTHGFAWDGRASGGAAVSPGEYDVRVRSGFCGFGFLGRARDEEYPDASRDQAASDKPVSDAFGCTYVHMNPRVRAGNYDLDYWCEKRDSEGKTIALFRIPAKTKALGPRPFYALGRNRNWLAPAGGDRWLVSAADLGGADDPFFYVFKTEELTLWQAVYSEQEQARIRLPAREPNAR